MSGSHSRSALAVSLFTLMLGAPLLVSADALAQQGASSKQATGGVGLYLGGGFPIDRDEPNTFRIGPRGWLWLKSSNKARLGLSLPFSVGFGNRDRDRDRDRREGVQSVVVYELVPSVKGALQLSELVRPYAEFGMGAALVTQRIRYSRSFEVVDTRGSFLIRTAVGAELTPRRKLDGLVVALELVGIHGRVAGHDGVDMTLLIGFGYEL